MTSPLDPGAAARGGNPPHSMFLRLVRWFAAPPDEAPPFAAAILDRFPVGAIFLLEGILKFRLPQEFGVGRFARIGIPIPQFFAPFDGAFEIGCGILLLLGLFTRPAVVPMIINMLVAIYTTKLPVLAREGFLKMAHAALLDYAMLLGLIYILIAGAGTWSLDERLEYRWNTWFEWAGKGREVPHRPGSRYPESCGNSGDIGES
jgi:putative oxidoreductase